MKHLEETFAKWEMDLALLEGQLIVFERQYIQIVGCHLAELYQLEAKIAYAYVKLNPENVSVKFQAEHEWEQAAFSEQEVRSAEQILIDNNIRKPTEKLKSRYREIAKRIHPDLANDEAEREQMNALMVELNQAFEVGDEDTIDRIRLFSNGLQDLALEDSVLAYLNRTIAQIEAKITHIRERIFQLELSEMFKLMNRVENAEVEGIELLNLMADNLQIKINERKQTLALLMQKIDDQERT